jgi:hypothetical protein
MRPKLVPPTLAWSALTCAALVAAALAAGCGSSGASPASGTLVQARQEAIRKEEDKANAILKKRLGKKAPILRSIKNGIAGGHAEGG